MELIVCGEHGRYAHCYGKKNCVPSCRCYPGYYFNAITKTCIENPVLKKKNDNGMKTGRNIVDSFKKLDGVDLEAKLNQMILNNEAISSWIFDILIRDSYLEKKQETSNTIVLDEYLTTEKYLKTHIFGGTPKKPGDGETTSIENVEEDFSNLRQKQGKRSKKNRNLNELTLQMESLEQPHLTTQNSTKKKSDTGSIPENIKKFPLLNDQNHDLKRYKNNSKHDRGKDESYENNALPVVNKSIKNLYIPFVKSKEFKTNSRSTKKEKLQNYESNEMPVTSKTTPNLVKFDTNRSFKRLKKMKVHSNSIPNNHFLIKALDEIKLVSKSFKKSNTLTYNIDVLTKTSSKASTEKDTTKKVKSLVNRFKNTNLESTTESMTNEQVELSKLLKPTSKSDLERVKLSPRGFKQSNNYKSFIQENTEIKNRKITNKPSTYYTTLPSAKNNYNHTKMPLLERIIQTGNSLPKDNYSLPENPALSEYDDKFEGFAENNEPINSMDILQREELKKSQMNIRKILENQKIINDNRMSLGPRSSFYRNIISVSHSDSQKPVLNLMIQNDVKYSTGTKPSEQKNSQLSHTVLGDDRSHSGHISPTGVVPRFGYIPPARFIPPATNIRTGIKIPSVVQISPLKLNPPSSNLREAAHIIPVLSKPKISPSYHVATYKLPTSSKKNSNNLKLQQSTSSIQLIHKENKTNTTKLNDTSLSSNFKLIKKKTIIRSNQKYSGTFPVNQNLHKENKKHVISKDHLLFNNVIPSKQTASKLQFRGKPKNRAPKTSVSTLPYSIVTVNIQQKTSTSTGFLTQLTHLSTSEEPLKRSSKNNIAEKSLNMGSTTDKQRYISSVVTHSPLATEMKTRNYTTSLTSIATTKTTVLQASTIEITTSTPSALIDLKNGLDNDKTYEVIHSQITNRRLAINMLNVSSAEIGDYAITTENAHEASVISQVQQNHTTDVSQNTNHSTIEYKLSTRIYSTTATVARSNNNSDGISKNTCAKYKQNYAYKRVTSHKKHKPKATFKGKGKHSYNLNAGAAVSPHTLMSRKSWHEKSKITNNQKEIEKDYNWMFTTGTQNKGKKTKKTQKDGYLQLISTLSAYIKMYDDGQNDNISKAKSLFIGLRNGFDTYFTKKNLLFLKNEDNLSKELKDNKEIIFLLNAEEDAIHDILNGKTLNEKIRTSNHAKSIIPLTSKIDLKKSLSAKEPSSNEKTTDSMSINYLLYELSVLADSVCRNSTTNINQFDSSIYSDKVDFPSTQSEKLLDLENFKNRNILLGNNLLAGYGKKSKKSKQEILNTWNKVSLKDRNYTHKSIQNQPEIIEEDISLYINPTLSLESTVYENLENNGFTPFTKSTSNITSSDVGNHFKARTLGQSYFKSNINLEGNQQPLLASFDMEN